MSDFVSSARSVLLLMIVPFCNRIASVSTYDNQQKSVVLSLYEAVCWNYKSGVVVIYVADRVLRISYTQIVTGIAFRLENMGRNFKWFKANYVFNHFSVLCSATWNPWNRKAAFTIQNFLRFFLFKAVYCMQCCYKHNVKHCVRQNIKRKLSSTFTVDRIF